MFLTALSSRAIIGMYYARLNANPGAAWVGGISNYFTSDQPIEYYKWLGQSPAMREWVGGRSAKGLRDNGISIENKHYEATLEVLMRELRRDKTGQIQTRINEMADRTNAHWASLLSTLILNGTTTTCYDGQYYFDTDHTEGDNSTNQSNKLSITLSGLPTSVHGSTTDPGVEEMQQCILRAVQAILGFKDDQNEPMNEDARSFLIMTPTSLWAKANAAVNNSVLTSNAVNLIPNLRDMNFQVVMNPRLNTWTDKFTVFRTDGSVKPLIRQEETAVMMKAKAEGSEYEFDNDAWQFGIDGWRGVGYGLWQRACLVTMT